MRTLVRTAALVESWFDLLPDAQRATARELQTAVLQAEPRVAQTVKWGNLVFIYRGANAMAIVAHRSHANLQFFNGHVLAVQYPQLEGAGRGLRHLKVRYGEPIDVGVVSALVRACIDEIDVAS